MFLLLSSVCIASAALSCTAEVGMFVQVFCDTVVGNFECVCMSCYHVFLVESI